VMQKAPGGWKPRYLFRSRLRNASQRDGGTGRGRKERLDARKSVIP
jgi:hypothetical protein